MIVQKRIKFGSVVSSNESHIDINGNLLEMDFFDRGAIQTEILGVFKKNLAKAIILEGERRAGKSSLISRISQELKNIDQNNFVHAEITQGTSKGINSYESFTRAVITAIYNGFGYPAPENLESISILPPSDVVNFVIDTLSKFHNKLVLVSIDEIDTIFETVLEHYPDDSTNIAIMISSLFPSLDSNLKDSSVYFLYTTVFSPPELLLPNDLIKTLRLPPFFIESDFDQLIDWILGSNPDAITQQDRRKCHELSGNWPFFLKWLCEEAFFNCLDLSSGWPDRALSVGLENFAGSYTETVILDNYHKNWTLEEKELLKQLAQKGSLTSKEIILLGETYPDTVSDLVTRGYILELPDGIYQHRVGILRTWFKFLMSEQRRFS